MASIIGLAMPRPSLRSRETTSTASRNTALPKVSFRIDNPASNGTPFCSKVPSDRENRAISTLPIRLPITGQRRNFASQRARETGWVNERFNNHSANTTPARMIGQFLRRKIPVVSTTSVANGSALPDWSKICLNCGTTKITRINTDATATTNRMTG